VHRRDERELAARLARVLDGQEPPEDELATLVTVLERVTEPARFDVPAELVERQLARVRPRVGPSSQRVRSGGPRLALAFGAVAAAAVALVVFTLVRVPGVDIEGKALAALGGGRTILRIEERIEPAVKGTFTASTRTVWLDRSRGIQRWTQTSHNLQVEDVLVEHGRISRYLSGQNLLVVGSSCRAFASGCAEVLDPIAFYGRTLEDKGTVRAKREGGVYHLTLPVQSLPDAVRIEQRVTIDAHTFLPKTVEWREQRPGRRAHTVSRIVIESVQRLSHDEADDPFALPILGSVEIEQRTATKEPVRKLGERRLTLDAARRVRPPLLWFGKEHQYRPLKSIEKVSWNVGSAYRLRYGSIIVWNFTNFVPPALLASRFSAPAKTLPVGNNVVHFYQAAGGEVVAELARRGRSVALVSPEYVKEDVIAAVTRLRALR